MIRDVELNSKKSLSVEVAGIIYFVLIVTAGIILVCQPARVAHMNQEARVLETKLRDLKLRNEDLKRMVATMESLTFVESQARDNLGMVDPKQVKSVAVNTETQSPEVTKEQTASTAEKPAHGIFAWVARIAEFMRNSIAVAQGRQ